MKRFWKTPTVTTLTSKALTKHINAAAMSWGYCDFGLFR